MGRRVLFVVICIVLLVSCGKRKVKLDRSMRRTIDTTAAKQKTIIRAELDSLCEMRFDSLVQAAVDSILRERQLERQKIIRKNGN